MRAPIMTAHLAMRIEQNEIDNYAARLGGLAAREGNPLGITIRRFGETTAMLAAAEPRDSWFNRAMGLTSVDGDQLDAIREWYRAHGVPCRFDIVPYSVDEGLLGRLDACGFYLSESMSVLYAKPMPKRLAPLSGVTVEELPREELSAWVELYLDSFDVCATDRAGVRESARQQYDHPGFRYYVARRNGRPAAIGALYAQDGVGACAAAATIPAYRGLGCQMALLQRRITDAAAMGCDVVVAQAACGTTSQRNMERAGLRLAYTKGFWRPRPAGPAGVAAADH